MRRRLALHLAVLVAIGLRAPSAHACAGDCGIDGAVSVDELVLGVNVALGAAPGARCPAADRDRDGSVQVSELIAAVNAALDGCPATGPRLLALSRDGLVASLDVAAPWAVRATVGLKREIASARCREVRCLVVHRGDDAISMLAADDLALGEPIALGRGDEPRDVALIDDDVAVVSLYNRAALLRVDLRTRATTTIDLAPVADGDGIPEATRLAACGHQVFAQLQRVDHDTGLPSKAGPALAAVDLDLPPGQQLRDADPVAAGTQAIALAGAPSFDMPIDCAARRLYVAEPVPLMQGGGGYEVVDMDALVASELPIATGAEVGGFEIVSEDLYWLITHTEFGPGPSSHLTFFGPVTTPTYNTFADEHVNDLALDREGAQLFFPDPCRRGPVNTGCDPGIHVFAALTGALLTEQAIDVGFPPIEVAIAR